jgi:hypothetical protein
MTILFGAMNTTLAVPRYPMYPKMFSFLEISPIHTLFQEIEPVRLSLSWQEKTDNQFATYKFQYCVLLVWAFQ